MLTAVAAHSKPTRSCLAASPSWSTQWLWFSFLVTRCSIIPGLAVVSCNHRSSSLAWFYVTWLLLFCIIKKLLLLPAGVNPTRYTLQQTSFETYCNILLGRNFRIRELCRIDVEAGHFCVRLLRPHYTHSSVSLITSNGNPTRRTLSKILHAYNFLSR